MERHDVDNDHRRARRLFALAVAATGVVVAVNGAQHSDAATPTQVDTPLEVDVTSIDFGDVDTDDSSAELVTVTNTGSSPFGPITPTFDPPVAAPFAVRESCAGETLESGETCHLAVTFHPTTTGAFSHDMTFNLSGTTSAADGEQFVTELAGNGVTPSISFPGPGGAGDPPTLVPVTSEPEEPPPARLEVDDTSLDFGAVLVGDTSAARTVTVTNTGGAPFGPITVFLDADVAHFGVETLCAGETLAPGETCIVRYRFSPTAVGALGAVSTFRLSHSNSPADGEVFAIDLTGTGVRPGLPTGPPATINLPPAPSTTTPVGGGIDTPLEIDVTEIDFGEVPVGSNATLEAVVTNAGSAAIGPITIGLGPPFPPFAIQQVCQNGVTLQPGESCPFRFTFTAGAAGDFSSTASIGMSETGSVDDGEVFPLNLTGTGIAFGGALIEVDVASLDFGDVEVGDSAERSVTISNFGDEGFGPIGVLDEAPSATEFAFVGSSCEGVTLAPGDSCRNDYAFAPMTAGDISGEVIVSISDPAADDPDREFLVALTGRGIPAATGPRLEIDTTELAFGAVGVGERSPEHGVTLTNTGDEDFGPMTILGGVPTTPDFFVVGVTCAGQTLAPGESCAVEYVLRPSATGPLAAASEFILTDGNDRSADQQFSIALSGTGTGAVDTALAIDVTNIDFGEVNVGNVSADSVATVTNTGTTPFGPIGAFFDAGLLGPVPLPFQASHDCAAITLAPGGTCAIALRFKPAAAGDFSDVAALTLSDTGIAAGGERFTIDVRGTGAFPLTAAPTSLEFGDVPVGATSLPLAVVLTNTSDDPFGPLDVAQQSPDGGFTGAGETCSGMTLDPDATCSLHYQFTPLIAGEAIDEVTFAVAATGQPPFDGPPAEAVEFALTLTGCGVKAAIPCAAVPPTTSTTIPEPPPSTEPPPVCSAPAQASTPADIEPEGTEPIASEPSRPGEPPPPTETSEPASAEVPVATEPPQAEAPPQADPDPARPPATDPVATGPHGFASGVRAATAAAAEPAQADPCTPPSDPNPDPQPPTDPAPPTDPVPPAEPAPPAEPTLPAEPAPPAEPDVDPVSPEPDITPEPPATAEPALDPGPSGSPGPVTPPTTGSGPGPRPASAAADVAGTEGTDRPPPSGLLPATGASGQDTTVFLAVVLLGAGLTLVVLVGRRRPDRVPRR